MKTILVVKEFFLTFYGKVFIMVVISTVALSVFQYYRNVDLKQEIKEHQEFTKTVEKLNKDLKIQIDISEKEKELVANRIDSVEKSEQYFKNKYYSTNEKLKKVISDYNNSDWDNKKRLFTELINN